MTERNKNLPRDTFLYLLSIISLVAVAVGFGMAVFNYIDFYFPDPAIDYYWSAYSYGSSIRQAMATLIVVFPVFLWVIRFLKKDLEENPEKKELKIRKWLLNLTLFAAAIVIIGDLITVINNFLQGELTARFLLKALTIFFISGSVFYYYLVQLNKDRFRWSNIFSWLIISIVVLSVAWGFVVIGSPFEQRNRRFDERRVSDLQTIQNQIINFWQRKNLMPKELGELEDSISGFVSPRDPATGNSYEYILPAIKPEQKPTFQLCTVFSKSNKGDVGNLQPKDVVPRGVYPYDNWQHDAGRYCFDRTIDPELYPSITTNNPKL